MKVKHSGYIDNTNSHKTGIQLYVQQWLIIYSNIEIPVILHTSI
jgi:hypothetical protein